VTKLAVALGFLALNFYTYHYLANEAVIPERRPFSEFPLEPGGGWVCPGLDDMAEGIKKNLGVSDFLLCNFRSEERKAFVNVYIGYHETQVREEGGGATETSIHPPAHCLPGSGWDIIKNASVPLEVESPYKGRVVRRLLIAKGEQRQLVYYWYHSRGRIVAEDWKKVVYVGLDRALRGRTDGSLVRFTMPFNQRLGGIERAEELFASLAPLVLAEISAYVPE